MKYVTVYIRERYQTSNNGCAVLISYMKLWFLFQLINVKHWIHAEINSQTPDGFDDSILTIGNNKATEAVVGARLTPR